MIFLPSGLLPKVSPYQSLTDYNSRQEYTESIADRLLRTGLYFHRLKKTEGIDSSRITTEMSSEASKITTVYLQASSGKSSSCSFASNIASFLLYLEEGSLFNKALVSEFHSLDKESIDFLVYHVSRTLTLSTKQTIQAIQASPHLLLQIQNDKNDNILEVLLERLGQRDSVLAELKRIKGHSIPDRESLMSLLHKSPSFSLFCWYVWHNEGGKVNQNFGNLNYGKDRLNEDPSLLFKGDSSLLDTLSSLQRKDDIFFLKKDPRRDTQSVIVALAKQCASLNGYITSKYIKKFSIDPANQVALIEIAKLCAHQNALGLAEYIENFEIDPSNQVARIEIVKICILHFAPLVPSRIGEFGIDASNQDALIEFAKRCAQESGENTAQYIQKFRINLTTQQQGLIDIARLCAQQNGKGTAAYIENFGIRSKEAIHSVRILCLIDVLLKSDGLSSFWDFMLDPTFSAYFDARLFLLYPEGIKILALLEKEQIANMEAEDGSPLKLNCFLHHLLASYVQIESDRLGAPQLAWKDTETQYTLGKIFALRNRPLKVYLTTIILPKIISNPLLSRRFTSLIKPERSRNKNIGFEYARLILLSTVYWSQNIEEKYFIASETVIRKTLSDNKNSIKDAMTGLNIACLTTLKALEESPLSSSEKFHLFTEICRPNPIKADREHFKKSLKYLQLLCELDFFSQGLPVSLEGEFSFETLESIALMKAQTAFFGGEDIPLDLKALLEVNYLRLVAQQRRPVALELYAKNIRSLGHEKLNETISRFTKSILNGSFLKERYDITLSSHLQTIQDNFPSLWSKWQQLPPSIELALDPEASESRAGGVAASAAVRGNEVSLQGKKSYEWLREKLIKHGHCPVIKEIPVIDAFLSDESKLEDLDRLLTCISFDSPYREMEMLCLQLCQKGISLNETIPLLGKLQRVVSFYSSMRSSQWSRDIDDRILLLSTNQNKGTFEGVITDNWQDLFLCGTEVLGSCQTIDGNLDLNKCLLGYCLDGKIQMAAVKDKAIGKIKSRAFLKLLFHKKEGTLVPCLFLEQIYPNPCPEAEEEALNALAMQRARELGVDLYTHNTGHRKEGSPVNLESLSSAAPFEYEDGGIGVSGGKYTLSGAYKVIFS